MAEPVLFNSLILEGCWTAEISRNTIGLLSSPPNTAFTNTFFASHVTNRLHEHCFVCKSFCLSHKKLTRQPFSKIMLSD